MTNRTTKRQLQAIFKDFIDHYPPPAGHHWSISMWFPGDRLGTRCQLELVAEPGGGGTSVGRVSLGLAGMADSLRLAVDVARLRGD